MLDSYKASWFGGWSYWCLGSNNLNDLNVLKGLVSCRERGWDGTKFLYLDCQYQVVEHSRSQLEVQLQFLNPQNAKQHGHRLALIRRYSVGIHIYF